jgi:hypothetical protein
MMSTDDAVLTYAGGWPGLVANAVGVGLVAWFFMKDWWRLLGATLVVIAMAQLTLALSTLAVVFGAIWMVRGRSDLVDHLMATIRQLGRDNEEMYGVAKRALARADAVVEREIVRGAHPSREGLH